MRRAGAPRRTHRRRPGSPDRARRTRRRRHRESPSRAPQWLRSCPDYAFRAPPSQVISTNMTGGASEADQGYFPRGRSMLRRVHEQRIVGLLYGQRGLMVGAVDPVVTVGTFMSSAGAAKPFDRLVRTARVFETTFLGTRAEADRELARVNRLHTQVKGELTRDAGPYPAGTRYDALDHKQMLWTLACIADSGQTLYEEF